MTETMQEIRDELKRLRAQTVHVQLDEQYAPEIGEMVAVSIDKANWHMLPGEFLVLLNSLPDGAGAPEIKRRIEKDGQFVWHGPAPKSRDTSP